MEDVLIQRFNYAKITVYKNYSTIPSNDTDNRFEKKLDYGDLLEMHESSNLSNKRNQEFFKLDNESPLNFLPRVGEYHTVKDNQIKRHYGNPFSTIELELFERKIRVTEDKITVSLYHQIKIRKVNRIFFKKTTSIFNLSINRKNGDIICFSKNKKDTFFRKNYFPAISNFIRVIFDFDCSNRRRLPEWLENISKNTFNNLELLKKIGEVVGGDYTVRKKTNSDFLYKQILKYFVEKKRIKTPNNYQDLIYHFYPTEKQLKKNERKLISSILDVFGVKSKSTIKLLHQHNEPASIAIIIQLCLLFGKDFPKYISSINTNVFINTKKEPELHDLGATQFKQVLKNHLINIKYLSELLTNKDKETIVSLINSRSPRNHDHQLVCLNLSFMNLLMDHLNMLLKIRKYYPDYVLRCIHTQYFDEEHREMSSIISKIKKGWTTKYQFNVDMLSEIEKPIQLEFDIDGQIMKDNFYPYVLKTEEEYKEEGDIMHHCVATYTEKETSIIISIRLKEDKNRVTCEYNCQDGRLIQARHFCNAEPPADFMIAVEEITKKTKLFAKRGLLHSIEKIRTPIVINGVEVPLPKVTPEDRFVELIPL